MKVHQIVCPKCKRSLTSKAGIEEGTAINCPKCKNKFAVAAAVEDDEVVEDFEVVDDDEEETAKKSAAKSGLKPLSKHRKVEEEEEETPKKPASKSGLKPLSKRAPVEEDEEENESPRKPAAKSTLKPLSKRKSDDDEDDEKPSKKKKGRNADDDEDDSPRSKRKSRSDDDEDEKPRRKKKRRDDDDDEPQSVYGKLKGNIYVRAGVLGTLLIILGIVAYIRFVKDADKKEESTTEKKQDDADDPSKPNPKFVTVPKNNQGKKNSESDFDKLQGTWRPLSMSLAGVAAPPQNLPPLTMTIRGDQITIAAKPGEVNKMKIDPTKSPAEIDSIDSMNRTEYGIYRFINPNTLEICISITPTRPTAFVSNKDNPNVLMRLERSK